MSDNFKRRLTALPSCEEIAHLLETANYKGHSKHKRNPHAFGLEPYRGERGDETLCDEHAGFSPRDLLLIPTLLSRGIRAGLVGNRLLWTVADNGWIFESRLTNVETNEYHGYPLRTTEAIAELVFERFIKWAEAEGSSQEKVAAETCRSVYGFKR